MAMIQFNDAFLPFCDGSKARSSTVSILFFLSDLHLNISPVTTGKVEPTETDHKLTI